MDGIEDKQMIDSQEHIAILLTCHNRKNKTLACLNSIYNQVATAGLQIKVILVDDGSTDGTSEEVSIKFPDVHIIPGNGELFWNHGMRCAMEAALSKGYDYYLWLNDDVKLRPHAISELHLIYQQLYNQGYKYAIVVGSTQDETTGELTYGGFIRSSKWHPLRFRLIKPENKTITCDNFHGNIVFIPNLVAKKVGNLNPDFHHQGGDHDYALQAKKIGVKLWLAPGFLGYCSENKIRHSWRQPGLTLKERIERMIDTKCLPWRTRMIYIKRHGGVLWPIWWIAPYIKVVILHHYYNLMDKSSSKDNL